MNTKKFLKDIAIYWKSLGVDPSGNEIFDNPIDIKCRWEDRNELFLNPKTGEEQLAKALIFVDRDLVLDSILWLGDFSTIVSTAVPKDNPGASAIQRFDKIPGKKGHKVSKQIVRIAYL